MTTQTQTKQPAKSPFISNSCVKCAHIKVCAIFRAIAPLLQAWEQDKPFEAEQLAVVCRSFVSGQVLSMLNEGE